MNRKKNPADHRPNFLPRRYDVLAMLLGKTKESSAEVEKIVLRLYRSQVVLELDKTRCIGCDICSRICPKQAVSVELDDGKPFADIDPDKCVLCEVCSHFCPVSCISLEYDRAPKEILKSNEAFPPMPEACAIDTEKCPLPCTFHGEESGAFRWCRHERKLIENTDEACPKHCLECVENCPREAIVANGDFPLADPGQCLRCMRCMLNCKYGSICVNPIFEGAIELDDTKCPPGCDLCINVCPVDIIERRGDNVFVDDRFCTYCGACKNICPQEAIVVKRTGVLLAENDFGRLWGEVSKKLRCA